MEQEYPIIVDEVLLAKYFAQETSPEEAAHIKAWLQEETEHQVFYDDLQKTWQGVAPHQQLIEVDASAAWQKFKQKLPNTQTLTTQSGTYDNSIALNTFQRRIGYLRIAAIFPLFFALAWLILSPKKENVAVLNALESKDVEKIIVLQDGSQVRLSPNSRLEYPLTFEGRLREVKLKGEAFFEIQKNQKPFVVKTSALSIKVIGTSFRVKAYPTEKLQKVEVASGKVEVAYQNKSIELEKNQTAKLDLTKKTLVQSDELTQKSLAMLQFEATPLAQVILKLNQVYQSNIQLAHLDLGKCLITVRFESEEDLENILEIISETLNLTIKKEPNQIIFDGKACE